MKEPRLESGVEDKFVRRMEALGWLSQKGSARRGWSDRFFYGYNVRVVIVEFKRDGARPRKGEKLQDYFRSEFEKRGFKPHKVTGASEAAELFYYLNGQAI